MGSLAGSSTCHPPCCPVPAPGEGLMPADPMAGGWEVSPQLCGTPPLPLAGLGCPAGCGLHKPRGNTGERPWPPLTRQIWRGRRKFHLVQPPRTVDHKPLSIDKVEEWAQVPHILANGGEGMRLYLTYAEFKLPGWDCTGTAVSFN